ncbi:hypothetical protein NDU88_004983 [Pleurodeles waltl]|uniref:Uncharacterized protein n=1 Tax=Pleurodeles waltl TaxID=8319 RepID=A0AAV7LLK7_PLEWA|nr:hypothetical protein NDU88_004983 [Pleurodeles waltl]
MLRPGPQVLARKCRAWLGRSQPGEMRLTGRGTDVGSDAPGVKPTRAELLAAIQGSREALEGKIESAAIEVNLLRADLQKVSDKTRYDIGEEDPGGRKMELQGGPMTRTGGLGSQTDSWSCRQKEEVEIQEDGTMVSMHRDVTIDSMETAVAEEADVVGTDTWLYIC